MPMRPGVILSEAAGCCKPHGEQIVDFATQTCGDRDTTKYSGAGG
jgi:hypothetical protein